MLQVKLVGYGVIKLRGYALDLLARREHSRVELSRKLTAKGYSGEEVESLLLQLSGEGLQCDDRYTESYVRRRITAGFGPRRIAYELQQRGITAALSDRHLHHSAEFWWQVLLSVWRKKYAKVGELDASTYAKASRFLMQRGFAPTQVHEFLRDQPKLAVAINDDIKD